MALSHYHVISRPSGDLKAVKVVGTYGSKYGRPGWGANQSAGRIAKIYADRLGDTHPCRIGVGYFMVGTAKTGTRVIQVRACYDGDVCRAAPANDSGVCPGCGDSTQLRDGTILAANDGYCSFSCRERREGATS